MSSNPNLDQLNKPLKTGIQDHLTSAAQDTTVLLRSPAPTATQEGKKQEEGAITGVVNPLNMGTEAPHTENIITTVLKNLRLDSILAGMISSKGTDRDVVPHHTNTDQSLYDSERDDDGDHLVSVFEDLVRSMSEEDGQDDYDEDLEEENDDWAE